MVYTIMLRYVASVSITFRMHAFPGEYCTLNKISSVTVSSFNVVADLVCLNFCLVAAVLISIFCVGQMVSELYNTYFVMIGLKILCKSCEEEEKKERLGKK